MWYTRWFRKSIDFRTNQQRACCHPVAICPGPLGRILALDNDFNTSCSRLLKIRPHQPADVAELQNGLKDSRDLRFSRGVAYIAERGDAYLDGKVRLNPNSPRSRADLERTPSDHNLPIDGTLPTLRKLLFLALDAARSQGDEEHVAN